MNKSNKGSNETLSVLTSIVVPNNILLDNNLTDSEKVLWIYINSKPQGWKFYSEGISFDLGKSSDSIRKYRRSLVLKGYLHVDEKRHKDGKYNGYIYSLINPYDTLPILTIPVF